MWAFNDLLAQQTADLLPDDQLDLANHPLLRHLDGVRRDAAGHAVHERPEVVEAEFDVVVFEGEAHFRDDYVALWEGIDSMK